MTNRLSQFNAVKKKRRHVGDRDSQNSISERPTTRLRKEDSIPRVGLSHTTRNASPQRSPSRTARSLHWHYTNAHSCLLCGKMSCSCSTPRPDPGEIKQKLGTLRLNTPYERAKIARGVDELQQDESRRRSKLVKLFHSEHFYLHRTEEARREIIFLTNLEAGERQKVIALQEYERAAKMTLLDRQATLAALTHHERERRQCILTLDQMEWRKILGQAERSEENAHLCSSEASLRQTILFTEDGAWNGLLAFHLKLLERFQSGKIAIGKLCNTFFQTRQGLEKEWALESEMIHEMAAAGRWCIIDFATQRTALLDSEHEARGDITKEESNARYHIREEIAEEVHCLQERMRLFSRQRRELEKMEQSVRQSIICEAESWLQQLYVERSHSKWEMEQAMLRVQEERERALQNALICLSNIVQEESKVFVHLLERETHERENQLHWSREKERSHSNLAQRCREMRNRIEIEESRARQELMQRFEKGEMNILEWIALKQRQQRELLAEVEMEKAEISKQEHERRLHLMFIMSADEEAIHRRARFLIQVLQKKTQEESNERRLLVQQEAVDFSLLSWLLSTEMESLKARQQEKILQHSILEQEYTAYREMICNTELNEWQKLLQRAREDGQSAWSKMIHRHVQQLRYEESETRAILSQHESEDRHELYVHLTAAKQLYNEKSNQRFAIERMEMIAAEKELRLKLVQEVEGVYERLYSCEREEQLELIVEAEKQIQEKLSVMGQYQHEDERLYNDQESLPELVPDKGVYASSPRDISDANVECESTLKLHLMLHVLGDPAIPSSSLSREHVDFAVQVIDSINAQHARLQDELKSAEKGAENAAKRLGQAQAALTEVKERKEAYLKKQKKDEHDHERRLAMDKLERIRGEQEIENNRQLLELAQEKLKERQNSLDLLRASINKQYGRKH